MIREFTLDLKPTGRDIELSREGEPLITHPTGLTWNERWGCFLGDTVGGVANIYQIDWDKALADGNLDHAVLVHIRDDAAVNGCRPQFVRVGKRVLLATADYGDKNTAIRLYDPAKLLATKRTRVEGVIVHHLDCGPFNQNLYWNRERGELVCIRNVLPGIGWRLHMIDLAKAIELGSALADGAEVTQLTFAPHTELEGYLPLTDGRFLFVTAMRKENAVIGKVKQVSAFASPAGNRQFGVVE